MYCWSCFASAIPRLVQVSDHANDFSHNFGLGWSSPGFGRAMRKHVRLHQQPRFQFQEPAAAVTPSGFHEIQRAVILGSPILPLNTFDRRIHDHHATWPKNRGHSAVQKPDVSVAETDAWLWPEAREAAHVIGLLAEQSGAGGARFQGGL